MKNTIFSIAISAIILVSCNNANNTDTANKGERNALSGSEPTKASGTPATNVSGSFTTNEIVNQYLRIGDGLANDNGKDAAAAGKAFVEALNKTDKSSLTGEKLKTWQDISDDAKEMAEHIGENPGNIHHQREHFVMLSKDLYDLVKTFGSGQVLYKIFDSMANDGKGAFWLSASREPKNPYMGKAMLSSGTIQEEIK